METHASFRKIPDNATLLRFGNCFRYTNSSWNIVCEFELVDKTREKISLAIECLPVLSIGRKYSKGKIIRSRGSIAEIDLPSLSTWSLQTFSKYEKFTSNQILTKEMGNQLLYRFKLNSYYVWIPCIELARIMFLKTAIGARAAFYESNLHRLIDVEHNEWAAKIRLAESYPHKLLDVKAHQTYLAWLMLNPDILKSYLSIYKTKLEKSYNTMDISRWAFQFEPFEMENVFIRCYTRNYGKNIFVEEISSVANLPMTDKFDLIVFDHPLDIMQQIKEGQGGGSQTKIKRPSENFDPEISDTEPSSNVTRARVLDIPKGSLYFNEIINTERIFKIQVIETGEKGLTDESGEERKRTLSVREGEGKGKHKSADFQSLENEPKRDNKFFDYIRKALHELKKGEHLNIYNIEESIGILPKDTAKRFLYIKPHVHRAFLYAEIEVSGGDSLHLVEIDLSDNHSLTTLVFRLKSDANVDEILTDILSELVKNGGRWDRQLIQNLTLMRAYIPHPKELSSDKPDVTFQNWASRIANEF
ncbi:MAG: hypothetical protein IPK77_05065 [Cellvibrio sp.]|nr:hypothetical protein [Cellvibrio sp.]